MRVGRAHLPSVRTLLPAPELPLRAGAKAFAPGGGGRGESRLTAARRVLGRGGGVERGARAHTHAPAGRVARALHSRLTAPLRVAPSSGRLPRFASGRPAEGSQGEAGKTPCGAACREGLACLRGATVFMQGYCDLREMVGCNCMAYYHAVRPSRLFPPDGPRGHTFAGGSAMGLLEACGENAYRGLGPFSSLFRHLSRVRHRSTTTFVG